MGDRIAGKAWRIMHTYNRRPLSTFATTITAVIALRLCLLAARRAGRTHPPGPGSARVAPAVSAQHDLVKSAMADEPKPRRSRRKMLVLLGVGIAAWLVRHRIRNSHGLDSWQHLPAAPRPAPATTPAPAAADTARASSSAASPNPVTPEPANPTAGPATGPVTATLPIPAPRDTPAPEAVTEPEPKPRATPDHPVTPAAAKPAPPQADAAEPAPPTTQPARPPTPAPDQSADAPHPDRAGAVPATSARDTSVTTDARADAPFGPGSVRARSDGSSPDPAYVVKGKTATKAFYTPAAAYYTRTRADVWFRTADDARAAGFTERAPRRHR
jgi:hypothetical protein